MSDLITRAMAFSRAAHQAIGQKRKYTNEPYYLHPQAVAEIVRSYGGSYNMIAAALLHDVLEDTQVPMIDLAQEFNNEVMTLVYELTDQFTEPHYGNRAYRKTLERGRLSATSADAQTIKYADLIHNTQSIVQNDPEFARVYLPEKRAILAVMRNGDPALYDTCCRVLCVAESQIGAHARPAQLDVEYKTRTPLFT